MTSSGGVGDNGNAESGPLIAARDIEKAYRTAGRPVEVLRGVSLDVAKGEMLAIVGASGVGKSTLMHVLGTLDFPDRGTVHLSGRDLFAMSEEERTRLRNESIGFIFQFHHLLPEFTAVENVAMPLRIARMSELEASARAKSLLDELGLGERAHHRPSQLSGGEQQRVAVARALVTRPVLVLADEPTGNLDTHTSRELVAVLRGLHERHGLTSVIVTHSEAIADVCDRVLRMEDGRLLPASWTSASPDQQTQTTQ